MAEGAPWGARRSAGLSADQEIVDRAPSPRRGIALLALALGTALALGCAELLSRLLLGQPGAIQLEPGDSGALLRPHPRRSYAYAPGFATELLHTSFHVEVRTNELGLRDDPVGALRADEIRVLAVGDSFTAGHGVEAAQSWPERLEQLLRESDPHVRVFNAGISGYGLAQIRLHAEELLPRLHPRLLVVGVLSSRYWRVEDPYVLREGALVRRSRAAALALLPGGLVASPFRTPWLIRLDHALDRHFWFGAHLLHVAGAIRRRILRDPGEPPGPAALIEGRIEARLEPLLGELDRLARVSERSLGAPLVIVLVNEQSRDGSFAAVEDAYNRVVTRRLGGRARIVDPLPRLRALARGRPVFRIGEDHHWSAAAHLEVARMLDGAVRPLLADSAGATGPRSTALLP
jgi:hypothetical protein